LNEFLNNRFRHLEPELWRFQLHLVTMMILEQTPPLVVLLKIGWLWSKCA
jgi:hypothetical protein